MTESILRSLRVFQGGFAFEAAQTICTCTKRELQKVLTNRELVHFDEALRRYFMATASLIPDEETNLRHFEYYLAQAIQHQISARIDHYDTLEVESANLEAAFEWAMSAGEYERALKLALTCSGFWKDRGRYTLALDWAQRLTQAVIDTPLHISALNLLGHEYRYHQSENRVEDLHNALSIFEKLLTYYAPKSSDTSGVYLNLGAIYADLTAVEDPLDNLKRAEAAYQNALIYFTSQTSPTDFARIQSSLGNIYLKWAALENRQHNLQRTVTVYQLALTHYYSCLTSPQVFATIQRQLGEIYQELGDRGTAIQCWREAERCYRIIGNNDEADLMLRQINEATSG